MIETQRGSVSLRDAALLTKGMRAVCQLIAAAAANGEHHGVISDAAWLVGDLAMTVEGAIERTTGQCTCTEVSHG